MCPPLLVYKSEYSHRRSWRGWIGAKEMEMRKTAGNSISSPNEMSYAKHNLFCSSFIKLAVAWTSGIWHASFIPQIRAALSSANWARLFAIYIHLRNAHKEYQKMCTFVAFKWKLVKSRNVRIHSNLRAVIALFMKRITKCWVVPLLL